MSELDTLRTEHLEQARLLGISGERECALLAEIARLEPLQYRQAPCHKFCESTAYEVEARGLKAQIERKDAALRVALEALMHYQYGGSSYKKQADKAITAIKEAL